MRSVATLAILLCGLQATPMRVPVDELLERYASGDFESAVRDTSKSYGLSDFYKAIRAQTGATKWINTGLAPLAEPATQAKRKLIVATFVLEVLDTAAVGPAGNWTVGQPPQILLEYACGLLRESETPLPAERRWHMAAMALIESAGAGPALDKHLGHASQRFSDEPRFVLATAIASELRTWPDRRGDDQLETDRDDAADRRKKYERAAAVPAVSAEAQLRWGVDEFRQNRTAAALTHFDEALKTPNGGAAPDSYVRYLAELFRGRTFDQRRNFADAVASYRAALAIVPRAQSAMIGLAAALVRVDQREEAARITNDMLGMAPSPADPWLFYGKADARFWPEWIKALRAEVVR
jgi:hypothetical protein